jgi:uncharacterized protein YggU (UPF0235/DUF167 family)
MQVTVIVHPNSKKPRIDTDLLGTLHIYVSAPPLEGKAEHHDWACFEVSA